MDGKKLRQMRKRKQLTQKALAEKLGVSANVISRMETGRRRINPDEEKRLLQLFYNIDQEDVSQAMGYIIYTDGGCADNPGGPGGIGIVIISRDTGEIKEISKGFTASSNNRMEVRAAIEALKSVPEKSQVEMYSDSQYLVNTMNGLFRTKKNTDLWDELIALDVKRKVRYIWVRGHNGDKYNERNGDEFDNQYKDPEGMFVRWWNREVDTQCKGREIKVYRVVNGMYVEG